MRTRFDALIGALVEEGVEFILIGGVAAIAHGAARVTQDVDVVYARSAQNLERIERALAEHAPYPRGAPPGLPFIWDAETLRRGLNFTLTTNLGPIDLLGEATGDGTYERLLPRAGEVELFGHRVRVVDLQQLIMLKRAAGRPKDFEALAELEALQEERDG
ncbi:MAG: hypothetical protein KC583_03440 [Myxococcales bacterium]|nr:hypothetical protein [Myxococcales bacterium]